MTKKWSSTKSLDGQTKRQASKRDRRERKATMEYDPEFVAEIKRAEALPPEAVFDNWEDAWKWLNK